MFLNNQKSASFGSFNANSRYILALNSMEMNLGVFSPYENTLQPLDKASDAIYEDGRRRVEEQP